MTIRPRAIAAVCVLPLTLGTPLLAWEPPLATRAHVRPLTADASALVTAGGGRSASIRELIDRLEVSNLVVYVDVRWFAETRSGRLAFVGNAAGSRYVIIQIACGQTGSDQRWATSCATRSKSPTRVRSSIARRSVASISASVWT